MTWTASLAALTFIAGCATTPTAGAPAAATAHDQAAGALPLPTVTASARQLDLPAAAGAGEPRQVQVLVDEPGLKLVVITLRQGTPLPPHQAPVAVTIQALRGAGTVFAGTDRLRLDATHAVALAPGVTHAVQPDPATDLVLLVHHLGQGKETHP